MASTLRLHRPRFSFSKSRFQRSDSPLEGSSNNEIHRVRGHDSILDKTLSSQCLVLSSSYLDYFVDVEFDCGHGVLQFPCCQNIGVYLPENSYLFLSGQHSTRSALYEARVFNLLYLPFQAKVHHERVQG